MICEDDEPTVTPFVVTTKTKDFLGRALANIATAGVDFIGRAVVTGDKDYMGRALVA